MIYGFSLIGLDYGAVHRRVGLPIMTSKTSMCQHVVHILVVEADPLKLQFVVCHSFY